MENREVNVIVRMKNGKKYERYMCRKEADSIRLYSLIKDENAYVLILNKKETGGGIIDIRIDDISSMEFTDM